MGQSPTEQQVSFDSEELILVDTEDQPVGSARKDLCHDGDGILHRAFSVFLWNADGQLVLQQRAPGKRLWGNYWSNACCSHPRVGESMDTAVERRLMEELGVRATVKFVYKFVYRARFGDVGSEYECCSVFLGRTRDTLHVNDSEIANWEAIGATEFSATLAERAADFTPWCQQEWAELSSTYRRELESWIANQAAP